MMSIEPAKATKTISAEAETRLPTKYGIFRMIVYVEQRTGKEHIAMVAGHVAQPAVPLVRLHSECLTGDIFGSRKCDCGEQLDEALRRISSERSGVIIYLRQEGRGIGLLNKIKAYRLQEQGMDTIEANLRLGFPADSRDYSVAAQILKDLNVSSVRLLTNNTHKIEGLARNGIKVEQRIPLIMSPNADNSGYLDTKKKKFGHLIDEACEENEK